MAGGRKGSVQAVMVAQGNGDTLLHGQSGETASG